MTAITFARSNTMLDIPHALAVQHMHDLRYDAGRRHAVPTRPVLARTRRAARTVIRWLWEGQLALVPRHLLDQTEPCTSC